MKYFSNEDHIYYTWTHIPVNRLDIQNFEELSVIENELVIKSYDYFAWKIDEVIIFDENY